MDWYVPHAQQDVGVVLIVRRVFKLTNVYDGDYL